MKAESFYEPVFRTTVLFMTDCIPEEIKTYLKDKHYSIDTDDYSSLAGSVTFLDDVDKKGRKSREYLVVVESKKDFYCLLHESHHLSTHIANDRMIPIKAENDEVLAYIQEYWFRTLWRFMNNKKVVLVKT